MASPVDKIIYYSLYAIGEGPYTLFVCSRRHLERFVCSLNLSLAVAVRGPRYCSTGAILLTRRPNRSRRAEWRQWRTFLLLFVRDLDVYELHGRIFFLSAKQLL